MEVPRCPVDKRGNLIPVGDRGAVDQDDMTAYAECGHRQGHVHSFFSGAGLRHERGAGEHFGGMQLEDGAIDTRGESEIVGIHDKAGHKD